MARKKVIEIVLDTETTGLDYTKEKIIEFAAIRLENGKIKDTFQTLINPEQHIRKSSMAIHGITQEMVADAPTEAEILPKIAEFIGEYPIVAHNAIFDYTFLNEASLRTVGRDGCGVVVSFCIHSLLLVRHVCVHPEGDGELLRTLSLSVDESL